MDILMILTNSFDPDPRVFKEAKALIKNGHSVTIYAWDRDNRYKTDEEICGIKIKRFYEHATYGSGLRQMVSFLMFCKNAKKAAKEKKYNIIHAHDIDGMIASVIINKGEKIIWDMHEFYDGFNYGTIKTILYELSAKISFRKASAIIYVSESQKQRYKNKVKKNILEKVVMNCPEQEMFENFRRTKSNKLRISFIGSVREYNTLKLMMDQAEKYDNVNFYIHGTGITLEKIYTLSKSYKNTIVTGKFNYADLKTLYEDTDIVYSVYNSEHLNVQEAFPVKGFEAIISKTPIIVSGNTQFGRFVKKNDIGFTINEKNDNDLAILIEKLALNKQLIEKKRENIKRIYKSYTWNSQTKELLDLYNNI